MIIIMYYLFILFSRPFWLKLQNRFASAPLGGRSALHLHPHRQLEAAEPKRTMTYGPYPRESQKRHINN